MRGLASKEGLFYGLTGILFAVIFLYLKLLSIGTICLFVFGVLALFFRYPDRRAVSCNDNDIYAPCDGRVVCVQNEREDGYFKEEVKRVSIFMSVFNVHINYSPISGVVEYIKYAPGDFRNAAHINAEEHNENNIVGIKGKNIKTAVRQVAGLIARRIVCNCKVNDQLTAGGRFGLIKFGSRVDVFMPKSCSVHVKTGDAVRAGRTIIGGIEL